MQSNGHTTEQNESLASFYHSISSRYDQYRNLGANYQSTTMASACFNIDSRYELVELLASSSLNLTVSARDTTLPEGSNRHVQIEKRQHAFQDAKKAKQLLRLLKIRRLFNHENVIEAQKLLLPRSREEFDDVYISSSLMETNLRLIIQSQQPLSDAHSQFFIYQVLRGLMYVHSAGIVHTKLQPRYLLVNSNCDLKICGFGQARVLIYGKRISSDSYIVTRPRNYCDPYLCFGVGECDPSMDIWAAGCILAELLLRAPFITAHTTNDLLETVIEKFGPAPEKLIRKIQDPAQQERIRNLSKQNEQPADLETLFPQGTNPFAIDLIKKMMTIDPKERITAQEALTHPYLKDLHFPHDEPIRDQVPRAEFEFENYELSVEQWKDLIYEEILLYHFEDFNREYMKRVEVDGNPFMNVINSRTPLADYDDN